MKKILLHKGWLIAFLIFACLFFILNFVYIQNSQSILNTQAGLKEDELDEPQDEDFSYTTLYEGIQVHIEGIEVEGRFFSNDFTNGVVKKYGGLLDADLNSLHIDPDMLAHGNPDLIISVKEPKSLTASSFFEDMLINSKGVKYINKFFGDFTKLDSFPVEHENKVAEIEEHVLQFTLDIRTFYSHENTKEKDIEPKHDAFGYRTDNNDESDNQRFPKFNIILSYNPSTPKLLLGENIKSPSFAVSSVELISLKTKGEILKEGEKGIIGVDPRFDASSNVSLHSSFEQLPLRITYNKDSVKSHFKNIDLESKNNAAKVFTKSLNNELFNRKMYSKISITNIGTQDDRTFIWGGTATSEAIRLIFAMKLFVHGDWKTKYKPYSTQGNLDEKVQVSKQETLVDRVLSGIFTGVVPTFGMGPTFRMFVLAIVFLIFLPFMPVIYQAIIMVASLLKWILKSIQPNN